MTPTRAMLSLRGVRRVFGHEAPVVAVDSASLDIAAGDFVALEGPSVSGKSTLLNIVALLDQPSEGAYTVDGRDVSQLSDAELARLRSNTFGFVFQAFHLMPHRTAADNVELGLLYRGVPRPQRRAAGLARLADVGLAHRADFATRTLSGGERQRVAIARATVADPPVLVADEPTGNLDSGNGRHVVDHLVQRNAAGTSVVLVTHDPDVAARARRRVQLRDGVLSATEVPADGTATDVAPTRPMPGRASRLRAIDLVRESVLALGARPGRSALLVGAIGIAVALVVVTIGLSQSSSAQVANSFDVARNREVSLDVPVARPGGDPRPVLGSSFRRDLGQVAGIDHAAIVQSYRPVAAGTTGQPPLASAAVFGVSDELTATVRAAITWAPGHRAGLGYHEAVVGAFAAADLVLGPLELAPTVTVANTPYRVVGVVRSSPQVPQLLSGILVDWRYGSQVAPVSTNTVYLRTRSGAARQVARLAPVALDPELADRIDARAPADASTLRDSVQDDVRAALLALSAVAVLAAVVSVANSMVLSVLERVGELGLRRAIGARAVHILAHTSCEAGIAGLLGGVAGVFIGVVSILAITLARHWQPVLDLRLLPLALAGGVAVGVLGGLPASIRASRIRPHDALRR